MRRQRASRAGLARSRVETNADGPAGESHGPLSVARECHFGLRLLAFVLVLVILVVIDIVLLGLVSTRPVSTYPVKGPREPALTGQPGGTESVDPWPRSGRRCCEMEP